MSELHEIKIGEEFKPSPKLMKLYFTYYLFTIIIGFLPWYIPTVILAPPAASIPISLDHPDDNLRGNMDSKIL